MSEVFINGSKVGTAAETSAKDAAIVASLALQHGCPMETIRRALARAGGGGGPLVQPTQQGRYRSGKPHRKRERIWRGSRLKQQSRSPSAASTIRLPG